MGCKWGLCQRLELGSTPGGCVAAEIVLCCFTADVSLGRHVVMSPAAFISNTHSPERLPAEPFAVQFHLPPYFPRIPAFFIHMSKLNSYRLHSSFGEKGHSEDPFQQLLSAELYVALALEPVQPVPDVASLNPISDSPGFQFHSVLRPVL